MLQKHALDGYRSSDVILFEMTTKYAEYFCPAFHLAPAANLPSFLD